MIKAITVLTDRDESLYIDLFDPSTSGMYVKTVNGIGPVKSDIGVSDYAALDGGIYTGSRTPKRNITMTLGFTWDPTIEEVRHRCYKFFRVKSLVRVTFHTDRMDLQAVGYVESNSPNIFSKDEAADISIVCPDPYLRKVVNGQPYAEIFENFGTTTPLFEFPFMNDSLTSDLIMFSNQESGAIREIYYDGEEPTPVIWTIEYSKSVTFQTRTMLTLQNATTNTRATVEFSPNGIPALSPATKVIVDSTPGFKGVRYAANGDELNMTKAIRVGSTGWPNLVPGANRLVIDFPGYTKDLSAGIQYYTLYGGI